MKRFTVLHLSDLHIIKEGASYPNVHERLIEDIKEQTHNFSEIVLIVTGDVVDKANFEECSDVAVSFFEDLNTALNGKIKQAFFTPGNHDKKRVECANELQSFFKDKTFNDLNKKFEKDTWNSLFCYMFDGYVKLITKISEKTEWKINTDLFYSEVFEINNCTVRINSLNSSLSSFNNDDYSSLHIGNFQVKKINSDYSRYKIPSKNIDITITIMHHPIFWMSKNEYVQVFENIMSKDSLGTDVLLRGHTHDKNLENHYQLNGSFTTLVTGIGGTNKEAQQRYSIYTFSCDRNLIEIIMRKSDSDCKFKIDFTVYTGDGKSNADYDDNRLGKLYFPMKIHKYLMGSYLKLPLAKNDFQPIFPSREILSRMTKATEGLLEIKARFSKLLDDYKQQILENFKVENGSNIPEKLEDFVFKKSKYGTPQIQVPQMNIKEIKSFLWTNVEIVKSSIHALFYNVCTEIANVFICDILDKDEAARIHFRYFDISTKSHVGLTEVGVGKGYEDSGGITSTPVKWGHGLIKDSFDEKQPLIYFNNKYNVKDTRLPESNWDNYFTYAPSISVNHYTDENKNSYPAITFGINTNSKEAQQLFETLSLLPLKNVIDDLFHDIFHSCEFRFEEFCKQQLLGGDIL